MPRCYAEIACDLTKFIEDRGYSKELIPINLPETIASVKYQPTVELNPITEEPIAAPGQPTPESLEGYQARTVAAVSIVCVLFGAALGSGQISKGLRWVKQKVKELRNPELVKLEQDIAELRALKTGLKPEEYKIRALQLIKEYPSNRLMIMNELLVKEVESED